MAKSSTSFKKGHKINLGRKHSEKTRERIKKSKMGVKNPMFGKHLSVETKEKMRTSHLGKKYKPMSETGRRNLSKVKKGKHLSPKTEFKGNRKLNKTEEYKMRHCLEYRIWQVAIYKKDNYACQICGKKCNSKNIVAHHVFNFTDYPQLRLAINNGVTLCRSCHAKIHQNHDSTNKVIQRQSNYKL